MKNLNPYSILLLLVIALFSGCEELLYEKDLSEETLVLTAPSDEAVFTEPDIILSWESLEGATGYRLQIATPSFEAALQIVQDSVLTEHHFPVTLPPDTYQWRVQAVNSEYETAFSTRAFTISN